MKSVATGSKRQTRNTSSAALLLVILAIVCLRAVPMRRRSGPVSLRARGTVPMGLAFGLGGVMHLGALAYFA